MVNVKKLFETARTPRSSVKLDFYCDVMFRHMGEKLVDMKIGSTKVVRFDSINLFSYWRVKSW